MAHSSHTPGLNRNPTAGPTDADDVISIIDDIDSADEEDHTGKDEVLDLVRELTLDEVQEFLQTQQNVLPHGHKLLKSAPGPHDLLVTPNMCVELQEDANRHIHFFWIKYLVQSPKEGVLLKGFLLKRHAFVYYGTTGTGPRHAILPLSKNDVAMVLRSTPNELGSPLKDECLSAPIPISHAQAERKVVFTNYQYPKFSYQEEGMSVKVDGFQKVEEHGVLCCRFKFTEEIAKVGNKMRTVAYQVSRLAQSECDKGKGLPDTVLQRGFRPSSSQQRKYSSADICAGMGGTFRAAEMAGLMGEWALDFWEVAVNTIRANWPRLRVEHISIQDFVVKIRSDHSYKVDVIHISFPCQGHSWLNRGTNEELDAVNNAAITTLEEILKLLRPRVVTLEQTNHILTKNQGFYFRKAISQISGQGYNLRWIVFNMAEYEVSQARHRLIIMASCPGQKLPSWPAPTHGNGPDLKDPVTVAGGIRDIPPWATLHNVAEKKEEFRARPLNRNVMDKNRPLKDLITTAGVQGLLRDSDGLLYEPTIRQQMRLQGFPDYHVLTASENQNSPGKWVKKDFTTQIGNAVPPIFMEKIFKEVIKALEESDKEAEAWENEVLTID